MTLNRKPPSSNVRRVQVHGNNSRGVMTNKADRIVQFENWTQRLLLLQLDRDPTVADYSSQPVRVKYRDPDGKEREHVPPFIVWRTDGRTELHDIADTQQLATADMRRRHSAVRQLCCERRWQHLVHTERDLPTQTQAANLLVLARYRPSIYADPDVTAMTLQILGDGKRVFLNALVEEVAATLSLPGHEAASALLHLLWHGQINTDLNQLLLIDGAIGRSSTVWISLDKEK